MIIFLGLLFSSQILNAQSKVFAYVKGNEGKPLEDAEVTVTLLGKSVKTDKVGYFQFVDVPEGSYDLVIYKTNYLSYSQKFQVEKNTKKTDLGSIQLEYNPSSADVGIITLTDDELNADESSTQSGIGLLQASRDAFSRVAAFELGAYWFRPRGVDNRYNDVLFNGIPMSKQDNGQIDFSNWGGLNDVTRYPMELAENINPSENTFGNLGGVTYYNTRASSYRKGTSLAYSFTNRSYFHRLMLTHSTGLMKNGWAFTVSGSRRWADEGVIEGTYQDAYAYFVSIEKRLGNNHAFNFTAFGAPTRRASNSPNTQEVYDLMGKDYNSYWGWQDGEKRNSRIRKVFEPMFQLEHFWNIGKKSSLNTTISYQMGRDARSRLDWLHANDPSPTYYRKLPSWAMDDGQSQAYIDNLISSWQNNDNVSQINWTDLYYQNSNIASASYLNQDGSTIIGRRAAYSLVEDVNEDKTYNLTSHFSTHFQDNWKFNANFNYQRLISDNFREISDLLGADFALNVDGFNHDNKFDVDNPSYVVKEGDRTQYSYDLLRSQYTINLSTEIDLPKWNVVLSTYASYSEAQRDGNFRHHLYLDYSKGKSSIFNNWDYGMKSRVTHKFNGKNFIVYNGAYFTIAPTLNEIFTNPRANDFITPDIQSQVINSNELSYIYRGQTIKLRASGYYTTINNATEISRYYAEGLQLNGAAVSQDAFVAEILSGVDKKYMGGELALDWKILTTLTLTAVASYGDYKVSNNPTAYLAIDSDLLPQGYENMGTAYIKDYKVAGTPQQGYSIGLRYSSPKYWWLGASVNYLADQYLDFSILNRTANFYTDPVTGDYYTGVTPADVQSILKQQKFDDQMMINASIGKSFMFGKYRMGISINVNNILDNRDYVTGGFEQGRKSNYPEALLETQRAIPLFGPKLWYDRGLSYFANVYLRF